MRSYFTPSGIQVVPRISSAQDWIWGLSLVRYGRGDVSQPVEAAELFADENRIRLDRRGIEEWFVNDVLSENWADRC